MPPQGNQSKQSNIPPPPPGYTLDAQAGAAPPPPPGYTLDQQQAPPTLTGMAAPTSLPSWEDVKNVVAHVPLGALKSAAQTLFGTSDTRRPLFTADTIGEAGLGITPAPEQERQQFYQNIQPQGVPEKLGAAGEQALEMTATGGPLKAGATSLASKLPFLSRYGMPAARVGAESLNAAINALAHGQDPNAAALVGAGGQAASEAIPALLPFLRKSAETQYAKVLNPTTLRNKNITQQVVPQLIDRNVVGTEGGLLNKAGSKVESLGQDINTAVQNVPSSIRPDTQNVVDALENYKKSYTVNGVPVNADAVQRATDLQQMVQQLGPDVSYQSLNRVRQILDKSVAQSGGYAGKTLSEGSMIDAQREAANAIRAELSRQSPDIAKINAEFHLWKGTQDVLQATAERRTGQAGGLIRNLLPFFAGSAGLAHGGLTPSGGLEAGSAALLMVGIDKAVKSGLFRTMSAVSKARLADLMGSGNSQAALEFLNRTAAAGASQIPQQPSTNQSTPQAVQQQQ